MNQADSFYITLLSDASSDYFPNNSLGSFTNKFPCQINLTQNEWQAGISEIYLNDFIPNNFGEDYENSAFIIIGYTKENPLGIGKTYIPKIKHDPRCDWKALILPTLLQNISGNSGYSKKECERYFIWEIFNFITNGDNYNDLKTKKTITEADAIPICINIHNKNLALKIPIRRAYSVHEFLHTLFSQIPETKELRLKISKTFEIFLESFSAISKPAMLFLYSDLIAPSFIGSSKIRVLKTIETKNAFESTIIKFNNIEYHNVEKKMFDNISIKVSDKFGYDIAFSRSEIPTKIVLHLKKK